MEKKIHIITQEVWLFFKKNKQSIPIPNYIISEPTLQNIPHPTTKRSKIHIYDISHKAHKDTNTIISINNHINKTGENVLRNIKTNKTKFFDITQIYKQKEHGKIAQCFGLQKPTDQNRQITTYFLCHYSIMAYYKGYKNIYGYIIQ